MVKTDIFDVFYLPVFNQGEVKNGFFIEAGADDFESDSNSVYFEDW